MTACPTPAKSRYATREAAERGGRSSFLRVGKPLRPYECGCGWWHNTTQRQSRSRRRAR